MHCRKFGRQGMQVELNLIQFCYFCIILRCIPLYLLIGCGISHYLCCVCMFVSETITGQMANGEASVSPSPPYTPHTFDANKMKQTVDHTNPFAVRNLVQGFDSAKHGSVTGQMPCFRTFPPLQTDLMQNPVKEVSNANLVRDMFMFDNKREREFLIKQFLVSFLDFFCKLSWIKIYICYS